MQISALRHKLILCSQRDEVAEGEFSYKRHVVAEGWAAIEEKAASGFSPRGASMNESRSKRTHIITMRYRWDLNISLTAWLYEQRLKSSPRWFKVLKVGQVEKGGNQFFRFDCRLVERSDDAAQPTTEASAGPAVWMPEGVKL
jgi:head-tail adaptor